MITRESNLNDFANMCVNIRAADAQEIMREGRCSCVAEALDFAIHNSAYHRAADVDGKLLAMWGVVGGRAGTVAYPWLYTTVAVNKHKLSFVRGVKAEVAHLRRRYPRMRVLIDAQYCGSVKLFTRMGFRASEPYPIRPGGALFRMMRLEASHG